MKCPRCSKEAITFKKWISGGGIKTRCSECDAELLISGRTLFLLVISAALGIAGYFYCKYDFQISHPAVLPALGIATLLLGVSMAWFFGGYDDLGADQLPSNTGIFPRLVRIGKTMVGICITALIIGKAINKAVGIGKGEGLTSGLLVILIPIWACGGIGLLLILIGSIGNAVSGK